MNAEARPFTSSAFLSQLSGQSSSSSANASSANASSANTSPGGGTEAEAEERRKGKGKERSTSPAGEEANNEAGGTGGSGFVAEASETNNNDKNNSSSNNSSSSNNNNNNNNNNSNFYCDYDYFYGNINNMLQSYMYSNPNAYASAAVDESTDVPFSQARYLAVKTFNKALREAHIVIETKDENVAYYTGPYYAFSPSMPSSGVASPVRCEEYRGAAKQDFYEPFLAHEMDELQAKLAEAHQRQQEEMVCQGEELACQEEGKERETREEAEGESIGVEEAGTERESGGEAQDEKGDVEQAEKEGESVGEAKDEKAAAEETEQVEKEEETEEEAGAVKDDAKEPEQPAKNAKKGSEAETETAPAKEAVTQTLCTAEPIINGHSPPVAIAIAGSASDSRALIRASATAAGGSFPPTFKCSCPA